MKNKILTIGLLLMLGLTSAYSQTADKIFLEVKTFYQKKSKAKIKKQLYFNKAEKVLDYGGINIPLKKVEILYFKIKTSHVVTFNCNQCIVEIDDSNNYTYSDGIGIEYYDKDDCYKFINLLSKLKGKE